MHHQASRHSRSASLKWLTWKGVLFLCIWGLCGLLSVSRFDRHEGAIVRWLGFPALLGCVLAYLGILKGEIIEALRADGTPSDKDGSNDSEED